MVRGQLLTGKPISPGVPSCPFCQDCQETIVSIDQSVLGVFTKFKGRDPFNQKFSDRIKDIRVWILDRLQFKSKENKPLWIGKSKEELVRNTPQFKQQKLQSSREGNYAYLSRKCLTASGNPQNFVGLIVNLYWNTIARTLNSFRETFLNCVPQWPINSLQNWLAIFSNRFTSDACLVTSIY